MTDYDIERTHVTFQDSENGPQVVITMYFRSGKVVTYAEDYPISDPGLDFNSDQPNDFELRAIAYAKGLDKND